MLNCLCIYALIFHECQSLVKKQKKNIFMEIAVLLENERCNLNKNID